MNDPTPNQTKPIVDASAIIDTEAVADGENVEPEILWKPLSKIQRRVAGVLVEKSKTTPDIYPMTLNGIRTASNQKSNRSPQLELREEQVEETLYELRELGAVIEVHSGGRVPKFKHQLYEWLAVEQIELAVMTELLLRGEQSLGDLRARASRMDKISGINELRPIVASLLEKNLMVELTPPGRGQIVTHNLYQPQELERLRNEHGNYQSKPAPRRPAVSHPVSSVPSESSPRESSSKDAQSGEVSKLAAEVAELRQTVESLQQQVSDLQELLK